MRRCAAGRALSPAAMSSAAALSRPTPRRCSTCGVGVDDRGDLPLQVTGLGGQLADPLNEAAQRVGGGGGHIGGLGRRRLAQCDRLRALPIPTAANFAPDGCRSTLTLHRIWATH
jgi:hypothetical protein